MRKTRLALAPVVLLGVLVPAAAVSEIGSPGDPGVDPATGALIEPIEATAPAPEPIAVLDETPVGGDDVAVDAAGHIIKQIGESGGLSSADGQDVLFEITVDSATVSPTCPGRTGETITADGEFLILHVTATVAPEMADLAPGEDVFMPVIPELFVARDAAGTPAAPSEAAFGCYGEGELILPFVEPGTTHEGLVVLEVAGPGGTVTYDPDGSGGWSWQLP